MTKANQSKEATRFDIVFQKLAESGNQKSLFYENDPCEISEVSKAASLLKEFQDNIVDQSYSFFTKSW